MTKQHCCGMQSPQSFVCATEFSERRLPDDDDDAAGDCRLLPSPLRGILTLQSLASRPPSSHGTDCVSSRFKHGQFTRKIAFDVQYMSCAVVSQATFIVGWRKPQQCWPKRHMTDDVCWALAMQATVYVYQQCSGMALIIFGRIITLHFYRKSRNVRKQFNGQDTLFLWEKI